jgi:hypothetical protein
MGLGLPPTAFLSCGMLQESPLQPEILMRMRKFAGMNKFKKEALRVRGPCDAADHEQGLSVFASGVSTKRASYMKAVMQGCATLLGSRRGRPLHNLLLLSPL